jgi:hypothetical protein
MQILHVTLDAHGLAVTRPQSSGTSADRLTDGLPALAPEIGITKTVELQKPAP